MTLFVLLLAVSAITSLCRCGEYAEHCYCVKPGGSENSSLINPCKNSTCHYLSYYTNYSSVENNSVFVFLSGVHNLTAVFYLSWKQHIHLVANKAENVGPPSTVDCEGEHAPNVIISCQGNYGLTFYRIWNLTIRGIAFKGCGHKGVKGYWNALQFSHIVNLSFVESAVCNSVGVGLYGYEIYGHSFLSNSIFNNSRRPENSSASSGNIQFFYEYRNPYSKYHNSTLEIVNSSVMNGANGGFFKGSKPHAGGLFLYLHTINNITFTLKNVVMCNNSGYNGGNIALTNVGLGNSWLSTITIHNCSLHSGQSRGFGAGLYAVFMAFPSAIQNTTNKNISVLSVTNSTFKENTAGKVGAGAYIQLHENRDFNNSASITFTNCSFERNFISTANDRGGSAVNVINFRVPDYALHHSPQFLVSFNSCNFTNNIAYALSNKSLGNSALYVEENAYMIVSSSKFMNNQNCSGISLVHSNLMLQGVIEIFNNTAFYGGGIALCANSILHLSENLTVNISSNTATLEGGGIFNEEACLQAIPPCFFQVNNVSNISNQTVFFLDNNKALEAGSALYGGSIDHCYYYGPYENNKNRSIYFNMLFNVTSSDPNDQTIITSNPFRACFCDDNGFDFDCSKINKNISVYSGGKVNVSLVLVGQRNGAVPGYVRAQPHNNSIYLQPSQARIFKAKCQNVTYTIGSSNSIRNQSGTIAITTAYTFKNTSTETTMINLHVLIKQCPAGFSPSGEKSCKCNGYLKYILKGISCDITSTTIKRPNTQQNLWWIGFYNHGNFIYSKVCPFDYCVERAVSINVTDLDSPNVQCAHDRKGTLCGECRENFSLVMGSTYCRDCTHSTKVLTFGIFLLYAAFGILFIFLIGILNINVTEGTLNAFIFYMNVVHFNTSYFDSTRNLHITKALSMMVAWVNFEVGHGVCFYNGMTIFGKVMTECIAPFYLWFLAGLIIFLGRKYSFVTKIFGKDTVKVLATIILFSYANLIRSLIQIWSPTRLHHLDKKTITIVWTFNGHIKYFKDNYHLALFVLAVVVAALTLPYTVVLLLIQCLRKWSNVKGLFWVNKLKPFFDAYTGPYKDRFHFWTGFLLLVRILLFVCIAASGDPKVNLTLIIITMTILLFLMQTGIYKQRALNMIETFALSNLIVLTSLIYFRRKNSAAVALCVGSMFILFCGIVIYHIVKKLMVTRRWGVVKVWLLDRRWPWMKRKQIRSLILRNHIDSDDDTSNSDDELDPILQNAPPYARYDQLREPLIETSSHD